ncbi:hypothetical protein X732_33135 [Mesorhizobium sp. L2C066B000]|nr:hypothetical protein X732_33135 [Mesorhizobium sp. L2C066B000]
MLARLLGGYLADVLFQAVSILKASEPKSDGFQRLQGGVKMFKMKVERRLFSLYLGV